MSQEDNKIEEIKPENDVISWKVKEYVGSPKSRNWYIAAATAGISMIAYAIFTSNYVFALIIIFGAILVILADKTDASTMEVIISDEGVRAGKEFYLYEQLDNFFIVYRPDEGVKNLYVEFKRFARPQVTGVAKAWKHEWLLWLANMIRTRLSIPLNDMNPLPIRDTLLKYLKENEERTDMPLSERLTEVLKF
jgi:hypothetical protein